MEDWVMVGQGFVILVLLWLLLSMRKEAAAAIMDANVRGAEVKHLRERLGERQTRQTLEVATLQTAVQQERERVQTLTEHILAMKRDGFVMVDTADEDEDSWSPPTSEEEAEIERARLQRASQEKKGPGVEGVEEGVPPLFRKPFREDWIRDAGRLAVEGETLAGRRAVLTDISVEHFPDETSE